MAQTREQARSANDAAVLAAQELAQKGTPDPENDAVTHALLCHGLGTAFIANTCNQAEENPSNPSTTRRDKASAAQQSASTLDAQGRPARKRSLLNVSAAAASTEPSDATSADVTAAGPAKDKTIANSRQPSKRSLVGKRRTGSVGSGSQNKAQRATAARAERDNQRALGEKPRKKGGLSGLLSIFNCCTPPKAHQSIDDDADVREVEKLRPSQSTQNTPIANKQDASQQDPAATDAREKNRTGDIAQNPNVPYANKSTAPGLTHGDEASTRPDAAAANVDKSLPPSPTTANRIENQNALSAAQQAALLAAAGAAGGVAVGGASAAALERAEHTVITDRTPQQKQIDEDIEMTDAPPTLPLAGHEASAIPDPEGGAVPQPSTQPQVNLPPPPPPAVEQPVAPAATTASNTMTEAEVAPPAEPAKPALLPAIRPEHKGRKCLVLDLDETLVHSSFKILHQADFTIPVEIEGAFHNVYVIKRPGVDQFMKRVGELYEVVVFTASVSKYGDPLLDQLDIHGVVHHRLFRESCYNHQGNYVKVMALGDA